MNGITKLTSKITDSKLQQMIRLATEVRKNAYCPYSKFQVGACVETMDGTLYTGCNVENASFTVGICAERTAFAKAISEGHTTFKRVVVVAQQENSFTSPCGACRQFMHEFGRHIHVVLSKPDMAQVLECNLGDLLPLGFTPKQDFTF